MNINLPSLPRSRDLHQEALNILIENMGIAKAAIFVGDTFWQPVNYLKTKDQLFANETVESIYEKVIAWREQLE